MKALADKPTLADWLAQRPAPAPGGALAAVAHASGAVGDDPLLVPTLDVLAQLGVDDDTLAAAIAAGLPEGTALPPAIAPLVEGEREARKVWALHRARTTGGGAEGLRRLLLAIIGDLRVVFVLLARQLVKLRNAAALPEPGRRALAELTADIHAPLANRLGIWQVKWEMEDLAFRHLQPEVYKRIAKLLDERRDDRERWIANAKAMLRAALANAGVKADVAGRPKHIFSIWKKMQRKDVEFEHLYDIRALRVLVDDVPTCYAALGVVHTLWPHVPGEFDDYIARPKGNDYRSLHTAVVGPEGRTLEVQIRTHEMHAHAELGVAAHWRYKEGGSGDAAFERKVAAMRRLLDTRGDAEEDAAFMAGAPTEILDDRVYLLTPQGKVVDMPRGATVLDFAYHVHTEVGHKCRGAKVNGRIVNLQHQPSSGDTVEILTGKVAEPRRDWITSGHGYLATSRAKEKVRAWFRKAEHAHNLEAGREILEKELKRVALPAAQLEALPPRFNLKSLDELYVEVGVGEIGPSQVARALHELAAPPPKPLASADTVRPRRAGRDDVVIDGVGNLLTVLARCCQPLPGDAILGWLTRGRGVSVHRANCRSLAALVAKEPARALPVTWGLRDMHNYEVNVAVRAYDRKGLLKDVSGVITNANAHVVAASTRMDP
ncbi:MAG TPA: bifunctional (p)ppGpp synthetase/guanosine-3',5'-bis(diphosphate) 3'-pyrophosphohydrolase, partial [Xanthomonadales bacterium]|nr:bifunctional (p)ppGpp synthetase/guanosine-3',5'-bis(diphosphate) 3'-pyrophosphohydrolase [Xanthomonadales bacterium]